MDSQSVAERHSHIYVSSSRNQVTEGTPSTKSPLLRSCHPLDQTPNESLGRFLPASVPLAAVFPYCI